jgi:hypothetical protein
MPEVNTNIATILKALDITYAQYVKLTPEEIDELIETKVGQKLVFSRGMGNLIPRGNPLLVFGRYLDFDALLKRFNKAF